MKNKIRLIALTIIVMGNLLIPNMVQAETINNEAIEENIVEDKNTNVNQSDTEENNVREEEKAFIEPFKEEFSEEIESINQGSGITLDGNMSDWSGIPYIKDTDKYGSHGEDITGGSYYIDKNENYLYLKIDMKSTRVKYLRIWGVKNKDTFNEFLRKYNTGGGLESQLISTLENDKAGVVAFSVNIEKLTSSEPTRVQVLNDNANSFKEQGYWVDEGTYSAEFRIPLDQLTGSDGSHNFDLVIGTDLYNWPTADFLMISFSSGSTGPIIAVGILLVVVTYISVKIRKIKKVRV